MLFLSGFNQTSQFGDILGKNSKCGISWKLVRWKVAIFHADRPIFMKLFKNIMRVAVFLLRQETRLHKDSNFRQLECITLLLILTLLGCDCSSGKCPRRFVCLSQNTWIWTQQQQQRTYRSDSTSPDDSSCSPVCTTNLPVSLATTVQ